MDAQDTGSSVLDRKAAKLPSLPMNEMFDGLGQPRPECARIANHLLTMEGGRLSELSHAAHLMFQQMGVTFNHYGDAEGAERIFPFDPVPRIISRAVWEKIEAGLIQRVRALNAFLADIYGAGAIVREGLIPRDLILGSPQFRHAAKGLQPLDNPYVTVAGIDLVRDAYGRFLVLEDNLRTPSGVSYVLQNRVIMRRLFPELLRASRVRSIEHYPADLLTSLKELSHPEKAEPVVALLTPGPYNSAFFEHVFLAQQMGVELVEGRDLVCIDHSVFMRTVHGLRKVDVLYRRVDEDYLDPVVFCPDSLLGVAGLSAAIRAGNVVVANAIGTGVADDKAVFAYTPQMIRYYLGEEPLLPIVETYLLRDRGAREMVLRDLSRYVIKPTGASGGYGVVIGPKAKEHELALLHARILRDPGAFIAQPMVQLSLHPTLVSNDQAGMQLEPRHIDLRPFVLMGTRPRVLAGGLTRVALREGSLIVNFVAGRRQQRYLGAGRRMLRRIADHPFWAARYLERAQWRARLVDVNYSLLLEVPPRDSDPWDPLLAISGETEAFSAHHSHADERSVVTFFALDPANPSSLRSCISAARANLRSLHHRIPSELWLEINRFYLEVQTWPVDALAIPSIPGFFAALRDRFYTIGGIINATMTRGLAYDFIETGTMLECADNLTRLLDVKYHYLLPRIADVGGPADARQWAALLRSASSLEAFCQIYGNAVRADRVVDLLIFNEHVPRSARFCVDRLSTSLTRIAVQQEEAQRPRVGAEGLLARLAAESASSVIAAGLHEFLVGFQRECADLSARISTTYMTVE